MDAARGGELDAAMGPLPEAGWRRAVAGSERARERLPAGKPPPAEIEMDGRNGRILMIGRSDSEANIALMTLRRQ